MLKKVQTLLLSKIEDEKEKRGLELSLMQAQINPHFLYNTLEMIRWKALDAGLSEIDDIIRRLSSFYRLSLNDGREMVSVEDEIRHVENYVELQNYRFGSEIQLDIQIPEELASCRIPKITLQPLVENSIQHGFFEKNRKTDCTVEIYGWKEGSRVTLMVQDNGAGMPQETLEQLLTKSERGEAHGYGIRNIHERIQLYCGKEYGLSFDSLEGEGTTVFIGIRA